VADTEPIMEKLLVANRGEIARRIMRTAHSLGIACVAVHSDPDAGSPHVAEADEAVRLPGERASDTYLRRDAIVEAALATGAHAVHPGYGFLSEDAAFAKACEEAGLNFVGPPSEVIEAMGSKLAAKQAMAEAGVPVLPTVEVPAKATEEGAALDGLVEAAEGLGWPVLVKASAGGGGRGMRVVEGPDALAAALGSAAREARAAFGDPTVFLEPYVARPRHVEVQILGDAYGTVVHLFERECSIQRRHQKIVEESPSPSIDARLRSDLGQAALRAARTIGYVNAGTVEFLLLEDRSFAFLEVNTRLQVEHTVTELVTGLDLVRLQLLVADGLRLPPEVLEAQIHGHAIEVRLYAEDPTDDWRPSAGRLHRFSLSTGQGGSGYGPGGVALRLDSGVEAGSEVSTHYDPLLAKLIAHAPTRADAARALAGSLQRAEIHGLGTNRDLLVRVLQHPEFLAGDADTGFLERHDPKELGAPLATESAQRFHALAAALAAQSARRARAGVLAGIPSGWRNVTGPPQSTTFEGKSGTYDVGYRLDRRGRLEFASVAGEEIAGVELVSCSPQKVVLRSGEVEIPYRVHRVGNVSFVDGPDGSSTLGEVERFRAPGTSQQTGSLVAPLPGTVVKVHVAIGDRVETGDALVSIEAMKMEHEVRAQVSGSVSEVRVSAGEQVEAGKVLVIVEPETADPETADPETADPETAKAP